MTSHNEHSPPPIITIDGPAGAGKGAVARIVATNLRFHLLDSGSIYRGLALASQKHRISADNEKQLAQLAGTFDWQSIVHESGKIAYLLEGNDVSSAIRTESCGILASQLAALPMVRKALVQKQHQFQQPPGLVAEGRDMGTTIFPEAQIKFFLTASIEERINRRYKQLQELGKDASIRMVTEEMMQRDQRDTTRSSSPLKPADDAVRIDTTTMDLASTSKLVLEKVRHALRGNGCLDTDQ